MKNWFVLFLLGLTIVSCRREPERAFLFETEYPIDFTIPAGIGPYVAHYFEIQDIQTYTDSLFAFHDVDKSDVESILPRTGKMTAIFLDVEYDFIKSIEIELYDEVDGVIKSLPAYYRDPVPAQTGNVVELVAEEADLQEFMMEKFMNVRIKLKLYAAAPQTIESRIVLKFAVR